MFIHFARRNRSNDRQSIVILAVFTLFAVRHHTEPTAADSTITARDIAGYPGLPLLRGHTRHMGGAVR